MSIEETINLLKKQWCSIEDLMKLAQVSRTKAYNIKNDISKNLEEQGFKLPLGLLPMIEVVKYLRIDLDYLERMSKL